MKAKQLAKQSTLENGESAKEQNTNQANGDKTQTTTTATDKTELKNTNSSTTQGTDAPKKSAPVAGKEKTTNEKQDPYQEVKAVAKQFTKEPENTKPVNHVTNTIGPRKIQTRTPKSS